MNESDKSNYLSQIQTDVGLLSFMTAVTIFINGLLLTQFDSYSVLIKVPIAFLIVSMLGFLFSSLIIANTSQNVIDNKVSKSKKHTLYGYAISEYIGVYLFVLSIPLAVNVVTADLYLRVITIVGTVLGLLVYQFMGFSLIERHFPETYKIFSGLIMFFGLVLYISQLKNFYFIECSIVFLAFILIVTILAPR